MTATMDGPSFPTSDDGAIVKKLYQLQTHEGETISVRAKVPYWMHSPLEGIKEEHSTSMSKVVRACFHVALEEIRSELRSEEGPIEDMIFLRTKGEKLRKKTTSRPFSGRALMDGLYQEPYNSRSGKYENLDQYVSSRVKDTILAEASGTYRELLGMDKSRMIRAFIGTALELHGGHILPTWIDSPRQRFMESYKKSRRKKENAVATYVAANTHYWVENGIKRSALRLVKQLGDRMQYLGDEAYYRQYERCIDAIQKNGSMVG